MKPTQYAIAVDRRDAMWKKACAWDGIDPGARVVEFSDSNPWVRRYERAEQYVLHVSHALSQRADRFK